MLKSPFLVLRPPFLAGEIPWQSASWASGRIFSTASRSNITMSSSLPAPPRSLGAWLGRVVANTWGIKHKYIYIYLFIYLFKASKKNISPVFYGPCNSLETKPSISVLFASFWKWSLSLVRFLQDIGPGNPAFAGLEAAVSTAPATLWSSNLSFSIVALKLALV